MTLPYALAAPGLAAAGIAPADMEPQPGTGKADGWAPRVAIKPAPSKIVVPKDDK